MKFVSGFLLFVVLWGAFADNKTDVVGEQNEKSVIGIIASSRRKHE